MKKIFLTLLLLSFCSPVIAQNYGYGSNDQNHYNTYGSGYNAYNSNTGSQWHTDYSSGGNQSGTNAHSENWNYDRSTGLYQNYSTGETRIHGHRTSW